ncbi:hypothetical protein L596_027124 [Steinernema carpocapsae]|uniref:Uncharacterized protein n=1 Tax=Steinernema carpocapsae TaxID=34508 RepID=A0A4U5M3E5_STECR|nr:hypothetical protein L596_027124 [Steinernema carpocapsae]
MEERGLIHLRFEYISLNYYGPVFKEFVATQIKSKRMRLLRIDGIWPSSFKNVLQTYESTNSNATIAFQSECKTLIEIDKEFFQLLLDRFMEDMHNIGILYGILEFDRKKLKDIRKELQISGKDSKLSLPESDDVILWKSPKKSGSIWFEEKRVTVFTGQN